MFFFIEEMAMDIIYKHERSFDNDNNFSIDLTSNNEIQNMFFKSRDEWLVASVKLVIKNFEETNEYKRVKKVCDLIRNIKTDKTNN